MWSDLGCAVLGVLPSLGCGLVIGKIAALASRTKGEPTTLEVEISHFVRRLTIFSFVMGWIFFGIGMIRHQPWISAFINGFIVVMIANVPEGLPMTVVSALTITAKRLAAKNVFIKQLQSVETLGSATVIASDKTGTLTMNKMSVSRLWFDQTPVTVEVALRDMPFQILKKGQKTHSLFALELVAALCNRSRFEDERELTDLEAQMVEMSMAVNQLDPTMTLHTAKRTYPMFLGRIDSSLSVESAKQQFRVRVDDSQRKTVGDPSDLALFNFVKSRQSIELMRFHNKKVFELPFNSRNKFAVVITKPYQTDAGHSRRTLLLKGAPEIVLGKCSTFMRRGHRVPIDQEFTESFQQAYEMFGGFGERVLGFAIQELDEKEFPPEKDTEYSFEKGNFPMTGLTFVGLISLIDPPKETVRAAIDTCRGAGIRFFMVTGDHPLTAAAIAKQVGIITTPTKDQVALLSPLSSHSQSFASYALTHLKDTSLYRIRLLVWFCLAYACTKWATVLCCADLRFYAVRRSWPNCVSVRWMRSARTRWRRWWSRAPTSRSSAPATGTWCCPRRRSSSPAPLRSRNWPLWRTCSGAAKWWR